MFTVILGSADNAHQAAQPRRGEICAFMDVVFASQ